MLQKFIMSALQLFFPRVCPVCGEILVESQQAEQNPFICKYCYERLVFIQDPKCLLCGAPLQKEQQEICRNCEKKTRFFDQGISLFLHDDNTRKVLYDLKYSNRRDNADFLALEAANRLAPKILQWNPEVLVPVSLHRKRQFERGFNQAELLANKLSDYLKTDCRYFLPVENSLLIRTKKTKPQKDLQMEERAENVAGKFYFHPDYDKDLLHGTEEGTMPQRVLLLDDIFTSGATINECARVLKQGGVKAVFFITMSIVG